MLMTVQENSQSRGQTFLFRKGFFLFSSLSPKREQGRQEDRPGEVRTISAPPRTRHVTPMSPLDLASLSDTESSKGGGRRLAGVPMLLRARSITHQQQEHAGEGGRMHPHPAGVQRVPGLTYLRFLLTCIHPLPPPDEKPGQGTQGPAQHTRDRRQEEGAVPQTSFGFSHIDRRPCAFVFLRITGGEQGTLSR